MTHITTRHVSENDGVRFGPLCHAVPVDRDLLPYDLNWADVDPATHPFDRAGAAALIAALAPARDVPTPRDDSAELGDVWTQWMTRALVGHYGRWVTGWRWARDEGELGGGPIGSWCCPAHSIGTAAQTIDRVVAAVREWRDWLVELAATFDRFPLSAWDRAVVELVGLVVARTQAGDAWYAHCAQVLTWFLTHHGVPVKNAHTMVDKAIGGRFDSWLAPTDDTVHDLADRLGESLRDR